MSQLIYENDLSDLLDRSTGGPSLYYQIIEILENMIRDGKIIIGEYLPSQDELTRIFKVSRITVRNALQELNNKGIVISERAKGARILKIPDNKMQFTGIGFSSRYRSFRVNALTKVVSIDFKIKNAKISQILTNKSDTELICMRRLRSLGEIPIALETSYIVGTDEIIKRFANFTDQSSLYQLLYETYGVQIGYAEEQMHTIKCDDNEIKSYLKNGDNPILYTERSSGEGKDKLPIEFCEIYRIL